MGADGAATAMATHNCFIDADWFFPALSLSALASDPTQVLRWRASRCMRGSRFTTSSFFITSRRNRRDIVALVQRVSALDLYLDAATLRPVALDFNIHPDSDAYTSIPAEIRFGAYQQFQGVWVPTRIQKYLQNTLLLDLTVTNVAVNSGVSASAFTLPAVV